VHERVALRFDRDQVWITHRGVEVARYLRSYGQGVWLPPPFMRAEPPAAPPPLVLPQLEVAPPELADTRSCAREQGEGGRAAALLAGEAEGAARARAARADGSAGA
jgi:hypothetical protein